MSQRSSQQSSPRREPASSAGEPQVRFTWNIHFSCNYRCPYCFFEGKWSEYGKRNVYKSVEEWASLWGRIHSLYGRVFITINGGEPFTYPDFVELIYRISRIHWPVNISTNTSLHLEEFVRRIDPERVSLSLSFHPHYHKIDDFLRKVLFLRKHGADLGCINFLAYPPFLKDIPGYVEKFRSIGESLKVIPFIGVYEGIGYPDGYDKEQRQILGMGDDYLSNKRRKGTICPAGQLSALLLPNGNVTRCGQVGDPGIFGNFFDPGFRLLEKPMPCNAESCPCDEWKVISDESPPEQAGAWLP